MQLYTNRDTRKHTHSLPSEMTHIQYSCLIINYIYHTCIYPSLSKWLDSDIFFFPFLIILILTHVKKISFLFQYNPYLHKYIYGLQKNAFYVTYFMISTSNLYKPCFPDYKTPRSICSLMYNVHAPNIQHTHITPTIHYMISIILHGFTQNPIKLIIVHKLHNTIISTSHHDRVGKIQIY